MSYCLKINIKGDLRTVSYLYSENVGEANKEVFFAKIRSHTLLTLSLEILNIIYIYFFLITSIQSPFLFFKQKKYLKLVSGEVVKSPSKCLKFNIGWGALPPWSPYRDSAPVPCWGPRQPLDPRPSTFLF